MSNIRNCSRRSTAKGNAGFTIVETLIVMAIASLLLLLVLEAIPALDRSGNNNQRRQDIQTILAAVSHYELNNSGNLPGSGSNFLQYSKLSYYDNNVQYGSTPSAGIGVYLSAYGSGSSTLISSGPNTSTATVDIYNYQKCSTASLGKSVNTGAGYSDVVALYAIESGATTVGPQCQQL